MAAVLAYLDQHRVPHPATLTHFTAKVLAHCLQEYPQLNHLLWRRKLYKRRQVDAFVTTHVRTSGGKDLSGFVVRDVPSKSLAELAEVCDVEARKLWKNENMEVQRVQRGIDRAPTRLLRPF